MYNCLMCIPVSLQILDCVAAEIKYSLLVLAGEN
jgi:hypothetical protein